MCGSYVFISWKIKIILVKTGHLLINLFVLIHRPFDTTWLLLEVLLMINIGVFVIFKVTFSVIYFRQPPFLT